MSRKESVPKRDVLLDPIHSSKLVAKLTSKIMLDDKRGTAQRIPYFALDPVEQRSGRNALEVFEEATSNTMSALEVKARRVGGSNYQVPVEVYPERRTALGLCWLVNYACLRDEEAMKDRLASEILDAADNTGGVVKRHEDTHKMAEASKASVYYHWQD